VTQNRDLQRARVLRLYKAGATVRQICHEVGIGDALVKEWVDEEKERQAQRVIAPAPYRRGFRWGAGW
jgi:transposase-like protein